MVLTFIHGWRTGIYGGDRVLCQDVRILVRAGVEVRVVLAGNGAMRDALEDAGAQVATARLHVFRRVDRRSWLQWPVELPPAVAGSDVVVLWTLASVGYLPTLRVRRIPTIVSVHEILPGWTGTVLARLAGIGTGLMANSCATVSWLKCHGIDAPISLAYPVAPRRRETPKRPVSGPLSVLVAGRVNGLKGQIRAVEALERVRSEGHVINLTLAGAPYIGQERHLRELVDVIRGRDWIDYRGEVDGIDSLLAENDLLLISSLLPESFGLVALEAWAAGRRAIAPAVGGALEAAWLVDGMTFDGQSAEPIAAAVTAVVESPRLREPPAPDAPVSQLCTESSRADAWREILRRLEELGPLS